MLLLKFFTMNEKNIDPESRNYSFCDIEDDPKLKRTLKEFWITIFTYVIYAALMIMNLFIVGRHSADFPKPLGFPLWIFILICLLLGMVITVEVICSFVYKDISLEPSKVNEVS